jgi:mannose/cellobiose epimerase-like protein (N-acyl-D-glucosamine 2-epimerase family)
MDKETLQKHLQALASGKETANAHLVEAYLADEQVGTVARLLERASGSYYLSKTPLLPPSSCLPLLD